MLDYLLLSLSYYQVERPKKTTPLQIAMAQRHDAVALKLWQSPLFSDQDVYEACWEFEHVKFMKQFMINSLHDLTKEFPIFNEKALMQDSGQGISYRYGEKIKRVQFGPSLNILYFPSMD